MEGPSTLSLDFCVKMQRELMELRRKAHAASPVALIKELETTKEQLKQCRDQNAELEATKTQLRRCLADNQELQDKCEALQQKCGALKRENVDLKIELDELEGEFEELRKKARQPPTPTPQMVASPVMKTPVVRMNGGLSVDATGGPGGGLLVDPENGNEAALEIVKVQNDNGTVTELPLKPELARGLREHLHGSEHINYVNNRANKILPVLFTGRDSLIECPDQTPAFAKHILYATLVLQQVDPEVDELQALIIVPMIKLAPKIDRIFKSVGRHLNVRSHVSIGGTTLRQEKQALESLKRNPHIVVATPGRWNNVVEKGYLTVTRDLRFVILEKVSALVSGDLKEPTRLALANLPPPQTRQLLGFTAVITPDVDRFFNLFMNKKFVAPQQTMAIQPETPIPQPPPETVEAIGSPRSEFCDVDGGNLNQFYVWSTPATHEYTLFSVSRRFLHLSQVIYCNSTQTVVRLHRFFKEQNFPVLCLHGGLAPEARKKIRTAFNASPHILVTTGEGGGAEGLRNVQLLINYETPTTPEGYQGRIDQCGATSLQGDNGGVINLIVDATQRGFLADLELLNDMEITELIAEDVVSSIEVATGSPGYSDWIVSIPLRSD